jgi:hypothetical protein
MRRESFLNPDRYFYICFRNILQMKINKILLLIFFAFKSTNKSIRLTIFTIIKHATFSFLLENKLFNSFLHFHFALAWHAARMKSKIIVSDITFFQLHQNGLSVLS